MLVEVLVGVVVGKLVAVGALVGVCVGEFVGVVVAVLVGVGLGVAPGATKIICDVLGMPLVKTVASAWPSAKPVTGCEVKEVSDQLLVGSGTRKPICSFTRLRSWTNG